MMTALIVALLFASVAQVVLVVSLFGRDPFSVPILLLLGQAPSVVVRPLVFTYLEDFQGVYVGGGNNAMAATAVVLAVELVAFTLVIAGFMYAVRSSRRTSAKKSPVVVSVWGRLVLLAGFGTWWYLVRELGGITEVFGSIGQRNQLFRLGDTYIVLEFVKAALIVGATLTASHLFRRHHAMLGWTAGLSAFVAMLTLGGRGAAISVIIAIAICHHYLYRRLRLRTLVLATVVIIPLAVVFAMLRDTLVEGQLAEGALEDATRRTVGEQWRESVVNLSYVSQGFDYSVTYVREKTPPLIGHVGEYLYGISIVVPRAWLATKADVLGSRLSRDLALPDDAIGLSLGVSMLPYFGLLGFPFAALVLGAASGEFWRTTVGVGSPSPLSTSIYATLWPSIPSLGFDLASFVSVIAAPGLLFVVVYVLSPREDEGS